MAGSVHLDENGDPDSDLTLADTFESLLFNIFRKSGIADPVQRVHSFLNPLD